MTPEEAEEILGPEVWAQVQAWQPPPLRPEQIALLAPMCIPRAEHDTDAA